MFSPWAAAPPAGPPVRPSEPGDAEACNAPAWRCARWASTAPPGRVPPRHRDRPRLAAACNNRGYVLSALREYEPAIADFDRAVALDPQFAAAYSNRGLARTRCSTTTGPSLTSTTPSGSNPTLRWPAQPRLLPAARGDLAAALEDLNAAIRLERPARQRLPQPRLPSRPRRESSTAPSPTTPGSFAFDPIPRTPTTTAASSTPWPDDTQGPGGPRRGPPPEAGPGRRLLQPRRPAPQPRPAGAALADYGEAIRLRPDFALALYHRGEVHHLTARFDHALADFSEVIRLRPTLAAAHDARGQVRAAQHQDDLALADFDTAIQLSPQSIRFYHNRARVYARRHDYEQGLSDHIEAIWRTLGPPPLTRSSPGCGSTGRTAANAMVLWRSSWPRGPASC